MKILLITPPLIPQSGWGRYSLEVINELKTRKDLIIEVLSETSGASKLEERAHRLLPLKRSFSSSAKNIFVTRKLIKSADVVHSLDVWPYGVYASLASIGTKKPLFMNGVGTYSVPPQHGGIKKFLMNFANLRSKEIFCISSYTSNLIKERTPNAPVSIVHLGLDKLPQISEKERNEYLEIFSLTDRNRPIILTVGQIKHRKGQLDTLKAIFLMKEKYPDILYVLFGSTDDMEYIAKIKEFVSTHNLEKNILIVDSNRTDKMLSFFYSVADLVALNSNNEGDHFEGFGLVLVEAASMGKPTIGSQNCGIEDAIQNGYNGYLTKQGDSKDISDKMLIILNSDKEKSSANAREFASRFSWKKTVDIYESYYKVY